MNLTIRSKTFRAHSFELTMAAILFSSVGQVRAETISWTGGAGTNSWHTNGNWDLNRVPASGDDVVIPGTALAANVTHSAGGSTINSLTCDKPFVLSGGTLTINAASQFNESTSFTGGNLGGTGDVTVNGAMVWTFTNFSGAGAMNANGGIAISGDTFTRTISQRTMNNAGVATYSGSGQISLSQSAVWNNLSGSTFEIQNTSPIGATVNPAGTFNNQGTLRKTSSGISNISIALNNDGLIEVQAGTLQATGGGVSSGDMDISTSSNFTLSGNHAIHAGASLNGAGTLAIAIGTTTFDDAPTGAGNLAITNGNAVFNGTGVLNGLTLVGGTLSGTGTLTVDGLTSWTFTNLFGTGVLNANGGIAMTGDTFARTISQRTLNNAGFATFNGTGQISLNQSAVWNNLPGSVFEIQNTSPIGVTVVPAGSFNNQGTLRKTSAGTSNIAVALNNDGLIELQAGALTASGGGTCNGDIDLASSCNMTLTGTHTINAGASLTGAGTLTIATGTTTFTNAPAGTGNVVITNGNAIFNGTAAMNTLALVGGSLGGSGTLTVSGLTSWTFSTLAGAGVLNANGGIAITGDTFARTLAQRTLNNAGIATFNGTGSISLNQNAIWNNLPGSTFEIQNTGPIGVTVTPAGAFNNQGTIRKTSTGTSTISVAVSNAGTIEVDAGILNIASSLTDFSGTTLTGGTFDITGILRFTGANIVTNSAHIVLDGATSAIQNSSGVDALANFSTNTPTGTFQFKNGRSFTRSGSFANAGVVTVGPGGGTFSATGAYVQTGGLTTLDGGTLDAGNLMEIQAGELRGNGSILADLASAGTCRPGLSPGSLFVDGNYTQSPTGVLEIEIGGLAPGLRGFDQLVVSGTASLAGAINVLLFGGYEPEVTDSFAVITAATRIGTFDIHNLPLVFSANCKGQPDYGATFVRVNTYSQVIIDEQPLTQAICIDDEATFSVSASGSGPFNYQWRKNGAEIPGAVNSSYTIAEAATLDAGDYDVIVTNVCGYENSAVATLAVNEPPIVTGDPESLTVCAGGNAMFTVTASGSPAPTYQWRKNGIDISGALNSVLEINEVQSADAGSFDCVVSNLCANDLSASATLIVHTGPDFNEQPVDVAACVGGRASFSVAATGTPAPTYQWRQNGVPLSDGVNVSGSASATLTIDPVGIEDAGIFDCISENDCSSLDSDHVVLAVFASGSGDANGDLLANGADLQLFVDAILSDGPADTNHCAADMNMDGSVDCNDIELFILLLVTA